ncbi:MAG TPA: hypothetical protein VF621_14610, partial [Pyrinomonadaceae bacterium]
MSASTSLEYLAGEAEEGGAVVPEHMVALDGSGEWGAWRWVGLRGAGFPAEHVLKLATPEYAALADRLLEAEGEARLAKEAALESVRRDLKEGDDELRPLLNKVKKQLTKGQLPEPFGAECAARAAVEAYRAAHARLSAAREEFRGAHDATELRLSQTLYDVAGSNHFREAVIWQNR